VGEVPSKPLNSGVNKKTILVVDDDPTILEVTHRLLLDGGHYVLSSRNGPEALLLSQNHPGDIDLLLTDFQMPEMSGIDLATAVTLDRPAIKVLMMSGFAGGMLVLNEGWHFLAKPFVASQLRSLVKGLLFPDNSRFRGD
jgi:CheY-like chemotaxis protein